MMEDNARIGKLRDKLESTLFGPAPGHLDQRAPGEPPVEHQQHRLSRRGRTHPHPRHARHRRLDQVSLFERRSKP